MSNLDKARDDFAKRYILLDDLDDEKELTEEEKERIKEWYTKALDKKETK